MSYDARSASLRMFGRNRPRSNDAKSAFLIRMFCRNHPMSYDTGNASSFELDT